MRIHRLALGAAALLAISSFSGLHHGMVRADDVDLDDAPPPAKEAVEPEPYEPPENSESFTFEAEVNRMLDIVVNSLYQNKDVFLRELISNASDALDKIRFMALTKPELLDDKSDLEVRIEYDADEKTLTIRDSGIGMTHDDLVKNLGTVARSGTTKFLEALGESKGNSDMGGMIGQFGVGFYSTFLVSSRVTVASKHPNDPVQHIWESVNGDSSFYVAPDPRGNTLGRGTEITLHLKEDAEDYADQDKLEHLVHYYSEFITHPIYLRKSTTTTVDVEDDEDEDEDEPKDAEDEEKTDDLEIGEEEDAEEKPKKTEEVTTFSWDQVNSNQALWTRDKDEITDDEYQAFWKVLSKEPHTNSTKWIHFNAEGNVNFKSILYLPDQVPMELQSGNVEEAMRGALKLYVRKVLISDEFELMPRYLSFIKGVVDSDDLPLNVNRESLQESNIIKIISKKLVRKAIELMKKFSNESSEKGDDDETKEAEIDEDGNVIESDDEEEGGLSPYSEWFKKFGVSIKMGIIEDDANQARLAKLLRFETSKTEGKDMTNLADYLSRMKDWQDDIYTISCLDKEECAESSFMEKFTEKDLEVVYLTEPIDEYMIQSLHDYEGKRFVAITKEGIKFKDEDEDLLKRREKAYKKMFKPLTTWMKKLYGPAVMKVSLSKRLGKIPAIVSTTEWGNTANMERIIRAQAYNHGGDANAMMGKASRVLEINPRHPIVRKLLDGSPPLDDGADKEEEKEPFVVSDEVVDAAWMLLDMALLNGGFSINDPKSYTQRTIRVMQSQLGAETLDLEDEIDPPVDDEEDDAPEFDMDGLDGINMEDFADIDLDALKMQ